MAEKKDDKEITPDDIEREAAALRVLTGEFDNVEDPDQLQMLIGLTEETAKNLEEMAKQFEAQEEEKIAEELPEDAESEPSKVVVVLTPKQRERVKEETDLDMETVIIEDPGGIYAMGMPETTPDEIEEIAVQNAITFKLLLEAHEAAAERLDEAIAEIEANASPEMLELLDQVLEDPEMKKALGME